MQERVVHVINVVSSQKYINKLYSYNIAYIKIDHRYNTALDRIDCTMVLFPLEDQL